jgi:hypothetical protein
MIGLNASAVSILHAIFGMGLLTVVMAAWMSLTRITTMQQKGIGLQEAAHVSDLRPLLPSSVRRVADNYNHLFEAPTLFYAIALAIIVAGLADPIHATCAWVFLGARIAHSAVQATINIVWARAFFFGLAWIAVLVMTARAAFF